MGVDDVDARADRALDRFLEHDPLGAVTRTHRVTALVLCRDGAQWLPRTLEGLASQDRGAEELVGIDVVSGLDPGGIGGAELLAHGMQRVVSIRSAGSGGPDVAAGLSAGVEAAHDADGDGDGVGSAGAAAATTAADSGGDAPPADGHAAWYWIVHDDSAPEPACLSALLVGADRNPTAAILVPKTVAWSDSGRLVGVGSRWAPGTPVVRPLDRYERDQGQFDVERPVYTGDSAGMLVRADVWHSLGGMDPGVGDWAGAADLCRRAWGSGSQVMFIPSAVLAHRQASDRDVRPTPGLAPARQATRCGQLTLELSQAPALAVPWRYLRAWLMTAVRAIALLLTREPEEASAEIAGAWQALGHPRRIRRTRRRLRRPPVTSLKRPAQARTLRRAALRHSLDRANASERRSVRRAWLPLPAFIWQPLLVAGVLAVAAFVRDPSQFLGSGTLRGGGLLPAPGALDLLRDYLHSWHEARFGTGAPMPAYLPLLSAASVPFLGSVDLGLRLVFGLAVPLAFLSCYASIGADQMRPRQRILTSLAYSLLPAGAAAMGAGRVSTTAVLLLGPPTARLIVKAVAGARAGSSGVRPAIAAGTMLGVLVAFAPSVYLIAVVAALAGWLAVRARWPVRTGVIVLVISGLFLVLWAPRVVRSPWLALSEVGVNDPSLGMPGPTLWGLAPGGPTSIAWAGAPILIVGLLAVLVIGFSARSMSLLLGALGLVVAAAWWQPLARAVWPDLGTGMLWPGVPLLLAGALIVLLASAGADRPGWVGRLMSVPWVLAVGVLAVGWWMAPREMTVGTDTGIPPVVSLDADSPARPRSLVLGRTDGELRYAVANGPQALLGDADALAGLAPDPGFADAVAGLVSGASGQVEQELGGRAIRFVVFDGPAEDPVVAELDATVGLRQLARAPEQSLWLVAGNSSRAELNVPQAAPSEEGGEAPLEVPVLTSPTSVDVVLHPETDLPRRLVVAERSDPGWQGGLAGAPLDLIADPRGMLWATVDRPGELSVRHTSWWPALATAQLVVFAGLLLLSLPKRRTVDPDSDADAGLEAGIEADARAEVSAQVASGAEAAPERGAGADTDTDADAGADAPAPAGPALGGSPEDSP